MIESDGLSTAANLITTDSSRKSATRRRILDAATAVISQSGYHGTSVDDIVQASGSSKGAFYFHFPSKEEMFFGLIDDLTSLLASTIDSEVRSQRGFEAKVDGALAAVFGVVKSHRSIARIVLIDVVGLGRPFDQRLVSVRSSLVGTLHRYLDAAVAEQAIPPQDTDLAARAWFGAINEIMSTWLQTGEPADLGAARVGLRDLLLRSVGRDRAVNDRGSFGDREASRDE
jgi:TetR/AcrR family transcriptional regulator, fatty acid metabolism regulator protein